MSASYEHALRALTAGRQGNWESEALKDLALFGNGLNLAPARRGADQPVRARRQAGPSKRVDPAAKQLVDVLTRWVTYAARGSGGCCEASDEAAPRWR